MVYYGSKSRNELICNLLIVLINPLFRHWPSIGIYSYVRTLQFVNFVLITDNNNTVEYVKTGEAHEAFFCNNEATQGHCVKLDKVRFVSLRQRRRALQFREFFNHRKNLGIIKKNGSLVQTLLLICTYK